jgi:hypothetical protein
MNSAIIPPLWFHPFKHFDLLQAVDNWVEIWKNLRALDVQMGPQASVSLCISSTLLDCYMLINKVWQLV